MIQFDEHIFQMGWFNHQLVGDSTTFGAKTLPFQRLPSSWKHRRQSPRIKWTDFPLKVSVGKKKTSQASEAGPKKPGVSYKVYVGIILNHFI